MNRLTACRIHHSGIIFATDEADASTRAFLDQLVDACSEDASGSAAASNRLAASDIRRPDDATVTLLWSGAYKLFDAAVPGAESELEEEHLALAPDALGLPPIRPDLVPFLEPPRDCAITDPDFDVRHQTWRLGGNDVFIRTVVVGTPWIEVVGTGEMLLSRDCWGLIREISLMRKRPTSARTLEETWRAWGRVRNAAVRAGAPMDQYLRDTRVILPEQLKLDLREEVDGERREFIVEPTFDGAPSTWLAHFDRRPIQSVYRIPFEERHYEVILEPSVERALGEIKKIPDRKVRGADAQRLITNPYAYFPPEVSGVLDEEHVEREVTRFRRTSCRFEAMVLDGQPPDVFVIVEPITEEDSVENPTISEALTTPEMVASFCSLIENAMGDGLDVCSWRGHDLLIDGYSSRTVDELARAHDRWLASIGAIPAITPADEVETLAQGHSETPVDDALAELDLSRYYERIEGIGIETPYAIARIPRPKQVGGWLPDDVVLAITPLDKPDERTDLTLSQLGELATAVWEADHHAEPIEVADGTTMPAEEAAALIDALPTDVLDAARAAVGDPVDGTGTTKPKLSLLIKPNIDHADFVKQRAVAFALPRDAVAVVPDSLKPELSLKPHQEEGVAWLQHLRAYGSDRCHGALLADDMGVGKTLQLMTVIIAELNADPEADPALVVAPVTLLENWASELNRFFDDPPPIRLLYGDALRSARALPSEVDPALRDTGRVMLRKDWLGDARIVLTTYETVRDYQFTLAEQDWSYVVCDEAQNIKNPNALKSRAVKKLKAGFRIAATGTPVENSLQDIWSIFDFIQPGLLPPLNHFNRRFRRPIESKSDDELEALQELRDLLHPQILRRTKEEVIRELPRKIADDSCLSIPMSSEQASYYRNELNRLRGMEFGSTQERAIEVLNALRYFRHLCVDPGPPGAKADARLPLDEYRRLSPKFDWLIGQLDRIQSRGEKVIVFVEMRDVQRQLRQYLEERYGLEIHMINGETSTAVGSSNSRQRLIDRFQASDGFNIIILSPLAAGVGLNIQGANHVIHYVRHWNPAREDQATDRAYRIGQIRDVHVYTPTVVGDGWSTFEETLDRLLASKRSMAADMLNGCEDVKDDLLREFGLAV